MLGLRTAKSCGPDAPTLASSSRKACRPNRVRTSHISAGDGGKRARSPGRARHKLLKPLRAGMPGVPVRPWRLPRVPHYTLHTRLRVQRAPGIPHALKGAKDSCTARALRAAGSRTRVWNWNSVIARAIVRDLTERANRSLNGSDRPALH